MANKLELTWVGKDERPRLEPRILLEDSSKSFHGRRVSGGSAQSGNRLIRGDNLLALKALEHEFTRKIQCIYIDPPYNTGSAFAQYDDGIEHSLWLSLMRDRLEILRNLLAPEGSIWVNIDDNEVHYLKVLMDEIFGRKNFVANVLWQKRTSPEARLPLGAAHDHILVYAADIELVKLNKVSKTEEQIALFKNPDNDPRGPWTSTDFTGQGYRPNQMYKITTPSGKTYEPPPGRCWVNVEDEYKRLLADNRMWFGKGGDARPRTKTFLSEVEGQSSWTWWPNNEVGHNQEAKKESNSLFGAGNAFDTPKPERLLRRILELASVPGDWVLDSFAGSGTTGAVAHKMGRRWLMVEVGEHCDTHILPRMRKVVAGEDQGGITAAVGWKGGGGFRYFTLAPSLLQRDEYGNWVINPKYNAEMLAEALCRFEGYKYDPSPTVYWQHGKAADNAYIYVTTQTLSVDQLRHLNEEVGPKRTLLVCCGSYTAKSADAFPRLTIKKIPKTVLHRCEWGRDDYSLAIEELPKAAPEKPAPAAQVKVEAKEKKKQRESALSLLNFGDD